MKNRVLLVLSIILFALSMIACDSLLGPDDSDGEDGNGNEGDPSDDEPDDSDDEFEDFTILDARIGTLNLREPPVPGLGPYYHNMARGTAAAIEYYVPDDKQIAEDEIGSKVESINVTIYGPESWNAGESGGLNSRVERPLSENRRGTFGYTVDVNRPYLKEAISGEYTLEVEYAHYDFDSEETETLATDTIDVELADASLLLDFARITDASGPDDDGIIDLNWDTVSNGETYTVDYSASEHPNEGSGNVPGGIGSQRLPGSETQATVGISDDDVDMFDLFRGMVTTINRPYSDEDWFELGNEGTPFNMSVNSEFIDDAIIEEHTGSITLNSGDSVRFATGEVFDEAVDYGNLTHLYPSGEPSSIIFDNWAQYGGEKLESVDDATDLKDVKTPTRFTEWGKFFGIDDNDVFSIATEVPGYEAVVRVDSIGSDSVTLNYHFREREEPIKPIIAPGRYDGEISFESPDSDRLARIHPPQPEEYTVRYTVDGSEPDGDSAVYTSYDFIRLPKGETTEIHAAVFDENNELIGDPVRTEISY